MKRSILPIFVLVIMVSAAYYFFRPQKAVGPVENDQNNSQSNQEVDVNETNKNGKNLVFPGILSDSEIKSKKAIIETEKGRIEIELYADNAPKTVSNFVYLVDNAFYDNLTFHRVESGFVVQGGDPRGDGTGGPGYNFPDETVVGEYQKGSVAMANSGPDTNGSQFFICLEDQLNLPKKYNLFGKVVSGMEVVSKISKGDIIKSIIIEPLV